MKNASIIEPTVRPLAVAIRPVYKIAAPWSDGTSRELKNYGLHARFIADLCSRRGGVAITRGSACPKASPSVVGLYELCSGRWDVELAPISDP